MQFKVAKDLLLQLCTTHTEKLLTIIRCFLKISKSCIDYRALHQIGLSANIDRPCIINLYDDTGSPIQFSAIFPKVDNFCDFCLWLPCTTIYKAPSIWSLLMDGHMVPCTAAMGTYVPLRFRGNVVIRMGTQQQHGVYS